MADQNRVKQIVSKMTLLSGVFLLSITHHFQSLLNVLDDFYLISTYRHLYVEIISKLIKGPP